MLIHCSDLWSRPKILIECELDIWRQRTVHHPAMGLRVGDGGRSVHLWVHENVAHITRSSWLAPMPQLVRYTLDAHSFALWTQATLSNLRIEGHRGERESSERIPRASANPAERTVTSPSRHRPIYSGYRPLHVLINLQNNPNAIARGAGDPRLNALLALASGLSASGHIVYAMCGWGGTCGSPCTQESQGFYQRSALSATVRRELERYPALAAWRRRTTLDSIDMVISWAHVHTCTSLFERTTAAERPRQQPLHFVYEHGFEKGGVTIDPGGLLGRSFYADRLNWLVQGGSNGKAAGKGGREGAGKTAVLGHERCVSNSSKRPQNAGTLDLPERVLARYILVPTQKFNDESIKQGSKTSMELLMRQVVDFAVNRSLPVVFKVHPHLIANIDGTGEGKLQEAMLQQMVKKYKDIFVSQSGIRDLMEKALFTATINGGTLFDNFVTQTPVLAVGRSMLTNHDGVVFDDDVRRGLERVLTKELPWPQWRRERQQQVVCWIQRFSLYDHLSPTGALGVLQRHVNHIRPEPRMLLSKGDGAVSHVRAARALHLD